MELYLEIAIAVLFIALISVVYLFYKNLVKKKFYEKKYSKIIEVEAEVEKSKKIKEEIQQDIENLRSSYKEKKSIFDKLVKEAAIYDEEIELAELGFYKPHFDFDTSEKYKDQIASVKSKQKQMVSEKSAAYCTTEWTVEWIKAKCHTMTN